MFNLIAVLNQFGFKLEDIKQIYSGKDNHCRCGCGGKYFNPGDIGFKRAINRMLNGKIQTDMNLIEFDTKYRTWLNIPLIDRNNKCYCLYFTEN